MIREYAIESKWIPSTGYSISNSYLPLRSSSTVQEIASESLPNPFDVNVVALDGNKIGIITYTTSV